ncbi:MAG: protein kinase [Betaproteobacteria bacterium]|nr:protein kinase [Betaproteobacteria bacterium]
MDAADIALPSGYGLHEYRIESTLGVGGFGLTYLATDANLNLRVAIKEFLPADMATRARDQSVRPRSDGHAETFRWGLERFVEESRTLASFRHPNIVRVMRFFQANATAYMVMEFVAGQPLSDWVDGRRPLSEPDVRALIVPVLDGLGVVHAAGILHRDIKPANIFIQQDGAPVLLDFGSARAQGSRDLTAIVTPGYAPLEQYHTQGRQGPWTDLYALGGVLYWTVTGTRPLEATARIREDTMPPATRAGDRGRYSDVLLRTIDWMLASDEAERPQSVADVKAALYGDPNVAPPGATVALDGRGGGAAPDDTGIGAGIESATIGVIEADLAKHIGPIATVIVRSAARSARTVAQLVEAVGSEIGDADARAKFVRRHTGGETSAPVNSRPSSGRSPSMPSAPAATRFDEAVLARAELMLARHLGPLAKVVVKRAAQKARDETELYLLIADEIDDRNERRLFIRKAVESRS